MTEQHGIPMSLSPRFDENFLGQNSSYTGTYDYHTEPTYSGPDPNQQAMTPSSQSFFSTPPGFDENFLGQPSPYGGAFGFHHQPPHYGSSPNQHVRSSSTQSPLSMPLGFEENFLGQPYPYTEASGFHHQPPHSGPSTNLQARTSSFKRSVGRPLGSKNKVKPPRVIFQDTYYGLKPVVIEVGAGSDVMEAVVERARLSNSGIIVLDAAGIISNVTLYNPLGQAPSSFTLYGPFYMLGLHGSYLSPPTFGVGSPSSYLPWFLPNLPASAIHSTFGIHLSSIQGRAFSGTIGGKVIAANYGVTVTAMLFKNPEYHSFGIISQGDIVEENIDNPHDGGDGGDGAGNSSGDHRGASGFGGDSGPSAFGMPGFKQDLIEIMVVSKVVMILVMFRFLLLLFSLSDFLSNSHILVFFLWQV